MDTYINGPAFASTVQSFNVSFISPHSCMASGRISDLAISAQETAKRSASPSRILYSTIKLHLVAIDIYGPVNGGFEWSV